MIIHLIYKEIWHFYRAKVSSGWDPVKMREHQEQMYALLKASFDELG